MVPGSAPRNEASKMLSGRLSGRLRGAPVPPPLPEAEMRSRRPPWAHMAPRSSQDPSGPSFWTLRPPSPGAFSNHFLKFPASFFEALSLPWVVLVHVRVRLRFMFRGLRRLNFVSLKPSMPESLGGRRGSRSDMNTSTFLPGRIILPPAHKIKNLKYFNIL